MSAARRDPLPNFFDYCEEACIKLWGDPTSRDRKELRWNGADAYSAKTFNLAKRVWGGSTLDLVAHSKGLPKQEFKGQAFFDTWRESHAMGFVPIPPPEKKGNGGGGPILATYDYHDESKRLLFQVVRYDTADPEHRFSQRRPDDNGAWIQNTKGVRTHVLYRLPALIAAVKAKQRVYICEGEHDANTGVELGVIATTMPGGVGKWRSEYDEFFRGADVVVISDNDQQSRDPKTGALQFHPNGQPVLPGQDHAAKVVNHMRKVAAHVRLIIFPQKDLTAWREAGGTREALDAIIADARDLIKQPLGPQPTGQPRLLGRPEIVIVPGQTKRIVDEIEAALLGSDLPLYKRGSLIVSPGFSELPTWDEKTIIAQAIGERGNHGLVEDAEAVADFFRPDEEGELKPCGLPMRLTLTLKDRKDKLRFPVLVGICNTPSISIKGELLDEPGFNPRTGILYDPLDVVFPRIPDLPVKSDITAAFDRVLTLLHTLDRDFVKPEDKGVALSTIMTPIARRGLNHAPLHGMDAPVAGSGKSLIFEIASILATGHGAVVMAQGETQEEFEKRLGTVLMRGDQLIVIDNCDNPLEGQTLNQCITQPLVQCRILGKSEMPWVQTAAMVGANGNNLLLKGDMVRRSIVGRLDPKCARPETRQYNFDPIAYAHENRPQLVVDILTLLKAYHNAGCPDRPPELQSFVHWSNTVRACIIWLGKAYPDAKLDDPCKTMDRVRGADPVLGQMRTVLAAWHGMFASEKKTSGDAVAAANATKQRVVELESGKTVTERFYLNPALRDALLSVAGRNGRIDISTLGRWLGKHAGRQVDFDDGSFQTLTFAGLRDGNRQWQAVKTAADQPAKPTNDAGAKADARRAVIGDIFDEDWLSG